MKVAGGVERAEQAFFPKQLALTARFNKPIRVEDDRLVQSEIDLPLPVLRLKEAEQRPVRRLQQGGAAAAGEVSWLWVIVSAAVGLAGIGFRHFGAKLPAQMQDAFKGALGSVFTVENLAARVAAMSDEEKRAFAEKAGLKMPE